jgi:hypothetical protein
VQVGRETIITLTQGSLRELEGVQSLEEAATELYKALQAGRDGGEFRVCLCVMSGSGNEFLDMAATMERLEEYRLHNTQFCKRMYDYLCIMFTTQVSAIPSNT